MSQPNVSTVQLAVIEDLLYANHRLQHVLHATMADLTHATSPTRTAMLTIQPSR
jgi:hypothetical protein